MATTEDDGTFPAVLPNTDDWPYGVRTRLPELLVEIVLCGGGLTVALGMAGLDLAAGRWPGVFAVAAVFFAFRLWRLREPWLILFEDCLAVRTLSGWRRLGRDEIEGLRAFGQGDRATLEVTPRRRDQRGVRINIAYFTDPWIRYWFFGARNLARETLKADIIALTRDPRYGATRAARKARLKRARVIASMFNIGCAGLAAALWCLPVPYWMVLAAELAAPILGALLVLRSRGLVVPAPRPPGIRPNVIWGLAPPVTATLISMQPHLIRGAEVFGSALLGGAVAGWAFWIFLPRWSNDWRVVGAVGLGCAGLLLSLVTLVDVGFDKASPQVFAVAVKDKRVTGARAPSHALLLAPWADQPGGWTRVAIDVYDRARIGSTVCLFSRGGALGLAWYDIDDCQLAPPLRGGAPSPPPSAPQTRA